MSVGQPIGEDDLHAYVDGALAPDRRAAVEAFFAQHPDAARRVADYSAQRDALRAALAPIAEEPVPPQLSLARLVEARRRASWRAPAAAAAVVLLIALGGAGGWALRGASDPAQGGISALAQEAAANYAVFAPDRVRPVEIRAPEATDLVRWLSSRLQRPVAVPDLAAAGYRFMGGRLVATPHGPAGLFLYDDDHGTRLAMLVRPMADPGDTPMVERPGAVAGFAWADRGLGYSLVAATTPETLHPLADEVRRQTRRQLDG